MPCSSSPPLSPANSLPSDSQHKPCAVVPVYNHSAGIQIVCPTILDHGLPCVLVDDGSDSTCAAVLDTLSGDSEHVHLIRFSENRGKGAAVCAGLLWAFEQGFSHALQIDADGQHDLSDIPEFIAASRRAPQAVVTGDREARGISKVRHYGRKLTDWLVWVETLSAQIRDSMCGYRIYPLAQTITLLRKTRVGQHMDFDTDILVRLVWRGITVKQVRTRVVYRPDIPSHFRLLHDNVRVTRMHIFLLMGMLVRLPLLIFRRPELSERSTS